MRDSQPNHYFGLDIGTSAVRCVIGMLTQENPTHPTIIGHGQSKNIGMRKGVVVHVEDVVDSVINAIKEAERISDISIRRATVNVNGSNVTGMNSKGVIAISTANREITVEDCVRVEEAATIVQLPPNREILQVFAKNFRVDGQDNIKDPLGMRGVRLEVDSHIITAATPNLRNLTEVLEKSSVAVDHFSVSSLAAIEAVLNRQQKESGTLVLDIGAGTTNLAVIEEGEIQHIAVIPVGGINVTNDLAIGLKTDLDVAEQVKIQAASVEREKRNKSNRVHLKHDNQEYSFSASDIDLIVEARLEELMEFVDKELQKIHRSKKLPGGVVIVGGTAKLPGIELFAREKLQLPARLGKVTHLPGLIEEIQDPSYVTATGLMILDMLLGESSNNADNQGLSKSRVGGLTNKLFKRLKL